MAKAPVLWVDFNDVDEFGRTDTLPDYALPGTDLRVGTRIVVGDGEGQVCWARVHASDEDFVVLDVELSFEAS